MANISAYAEKAMLDWVLGGAAVTQPPTRAIGLSLGSPTSVSGSEMTTLGYVRQTGGVTTPFGAANASGTAYNTVPFTFGTFNAAGSVSGIQIWDTPGSSNSGNMLWYGLLAAPRTVNSGDSIVIATSALTVTLA